MSFEYKGIVEHDVPYDSIVISTDDNYAYHCYCDVEQEGTDCLAKVFLYKTDFSGELIASQTIQEELDISSCYSIKTFYGADDTHIYAFVLVYAPEGGNYYKIFGFKILKTDFSYTFGLLTSSPYDYCRVVVVKDYIYCWDYGSIRVFEKDFDYITTINIYSGVAGDFFIRLDGSAFDNYLIGRDFLVPKYILFVFNYETNVAFTVDDLDYLWGTFFHANTNVYRINGDILRLFVIDEINEELNGGDTIAYLDPYYIGHGHFNNKIILFTASYPDSKAYLVAGDAVTSSPVFGNTFSYGGKYPFGYFKTNSLIKVD